VIVITGAGDRAFCAGADISEIQDLNALEARIYSLWIQEHTSHRALLSLGIIKLAINKGIEMDLDRALYYEAECFGSALATEDSKEGARAFLEKRKPEFKGK